MKYTGTLLSVKDLAQSIRFYQELFGLEILNDFGSNVALSGGLSLQTAESWAGFISKEEDEIIYRNNASEIGFEAEDFNSFVDRLSSMPGISFVHPPLEHRWGQRVVRLYDPDGHIIEVGESIDIVVKRFAWQGLTVEETARRMDVTVDYVTASLARLPGD